ncbi:iron uptake porin [Stenomitos frigidus]|uniref:iron uptake porin n=1 Tax=Stenomitos frigidus TaxID=1886765 RepID=UPI001FE9FC10|nr:iron uptake porin [Stenomitos frigidus]
MRQQQQAACTVAKPRYCCGAGDVGKTLNAVVFQSSTASVASLAWAVAAAAFAHRNRSSDDATILYAAGYLGFPDLGKKGNLGGILVGITPYVIDNNGLTAARQDNDTPFYVEAFYRYPLTDNIAITPGLFVLFNPEGNSTNATQYVGVIRTTFTF